MSSTISCAYKLTVVGARPLAGFQTAMAAVPVDLTLPNLYGLLYNSDVTTSGGAIITRTMRFSMVPNSSATASSTLAPGDSLNKSLTSVIVETNGDGYAAPPLVTFAITSGNPPLRAARARCLMSTGSPILIKGGTGYTVPPAVFFGGGQLVPGGVQATGHATVGGGAVTSVVIDTPGGPYNVPPAISFGGPGTGAVATVGLIVNSMVLDDPGLGYATAPSVVLTPLFKTYFPDGSSNQGSSLSEFMRATLQFSLQTPIVAVAPAIS